MISHENALKLLHQHIQSAQMIKHSLASEAVLRSIALKLNENEEEWGLAGLLHDIDVELTHADPLTHGPYAAGMLEGLLSAEAIDAIVMHNEMATGKERTTVFQHALAVVVKESLPRVLHRARFGAGRASRRRAGVRPLPGLQRPHRRPHRRQRRRWADYRGGRPR